MIVCTQGCCNGCGDCSGYAIGCHQDPCRCDQPCTGWDEEPLRASSMRASHVISTACLTITATSAPQYRWLVAPPITHSIEVFVKDLPEVRAALEAARALAARHAALVALARAVVDSSAGGQSFTTRSGTPISQTFVDGQAFAALRAALDEVKP